ncbi:MAG: hypothetical protein K2H76_01055 [Muribaculaceae bacterium]|nr:hypothetical protein [Muribaculaceae bacterium]
MKKIITLSLLLALGAGAYAETIELLSFGDGFPQPTEPPLLGLSISPNGKYVCGGLDMGTGIFVLNRETGKIEWEMCGDDGGEVRDVDDNGLAIGFMDFTGASTSVSATGDHGLTLSCETDELEILPTPQKYRGVIGEGLTNGGKVMIASLTTSSFATKAAYRVDGGNWQILPDVKEEDLGWYKGAFRPEESAAKFVSEDGKVIYGCLGGFAVPTVWIMNEQGEYEMDFFPGRILGADDNDIQSISAMYGMQMSNDGKYLLMMVSVPNEAGVNRSAPAVYNTETRELTVYDNTQPIDEGGAGLYPTAISNNGTIIGCIGQPYYGSAGSFIIKGGETVAQTFSEAFPSFYELLGPAEELGYTVPTSLSADGRYILGYTYYCEDYMDANADAYYVSFVIDRGEGAGVDEIASEQAAPAMEAIYTLDGQRVEKLGKGINIIRMSDGTSRKVMVK